MKSKIKHKPNNQYRIYSPDKSDTDMSVAFRRRANISNNVLTEPITGTGGQGIVRVLLQAGGGNGSAVWSGQADLATVPPRVLTHLTEV